MIGTAEGVTGFAAVTAVLATAFAMGAVVERTATVHAVVRYCDAAYLVYLGGGTT